MRNNEFYCFRCGQEGPPIKQRPSQVLGLCSCHEEWYVGTVPNLIDLLNEAYIRLEELGEENSVLREYNEDGEELNDLFNYESEMDD